MEMTSFYFIRHCETDMNTKRHLVGGRSNNTPPTNRGLEQSRQLGLFLRRANIIPHAVFSSGAVRTNTTAEIALSTAGIAIPIIEDERLFEMSQGIYDGHLRDEVYTEENKKKYEIETMHGKFPGGDSMFDLQSRKREFLDEKHLEYPRGIIVIFGHGLAIRALVGQIRGSTRAEILSSETDNVSLTRIDVIDGQPEVLYVGKKVIGE